jgi:hypothetical protein
LVLLLLPWKIFHKKKIAAALRMMLIELKVSVKARMLSNAAQEVAFLGGFAAHTHFIIMHQMMSITIRSAFSAIN